MQDREVGELAHLAAALLDHLHLVLGPKHARLVSGIAKRGRTLIAIFQWHRRERYLVDDRGLDLDLGRVGLRRRLDGIALLAEVHVERHHQVLAQRVDGRVGYLDTACQLERWVVVEGGVAGVDCGLASETRDVRSDLGEALLEVVVEDVGLLGEDGQRRVVTHAEGGLLAGRRHVRDLHLHVL